MSPLGSVTIGAMVLQNDPLIVWTAGHPGARSWHPAGAIAVACPDLSRRDRLAVQGDPDDVVALLTEVLPEIGATYRPLGDEDLITSVAERLDGVVKVGRFGWMDITMPVATPGAGEWITDLDDVSGLLATAAEAWSVPEIGFVAGVATRAEARGRGLAAALCGFVTNELLRDRQRV